MIKKGEIHMKNSNKTLKSTLLFALTITLLLTLSSCGWLNAFIGQLKGELIGNDYIITEYDNFGNPVLQVVGDKITLDGTVDSAGEPTSYITVTVDGYEWEHVGSTLVFAQNGVDMVTDFDLPEIIETHGSTSTGLMDVDRVVNHYKNLFGKKSVVIVSSQNGTPIGLFQGDNCYVEIPDDLPKTTLVNIDGKMVYIHRGDVDIMPASMFNSN